MKDDNNKTQCNVYIKDDEHAVKLYKRLLSTMNELPKQTRPSNVMLSTGICIGIADSMYDLDYMDEASLRNINNLIEMILKDVMNNIKDSTQEDTST